MSIDGTKVAEALVEDGINHACHQLTMRLSDIHMASRRDAEARTRRSDVAAWLKTMFETETFHLRDDPSEEDLRACLCNGSLLCQLINNLNPGSIPKIISSPGLVSTEGALHSAYQRFENVRNFLVAIDGLRLPTFEASDLEQGSMVTVVDCLLSLKEYYDWKHGMEGHSLWKQGADIGTPNEIKSTERVSSPGKLLSSTLKSGGQARKRWILPDLDYCAASDNQLVDESQGLNGQKIGKFPINPGDCRGNAGLERTFDVESLLSSSVMSDSTSSWIQHVGQKFREVLQVKAMRYPDIQAVESSGLLKCLDNAPSQSLLSLVSAILGDKQNEEVPSLVEFMLRKVMEEFERRLLSQGEHIKKLKYALREVIAREDKILSRANGLEALAAGTVEEIKLLTDQLHKIKMEKTQVEDERKAKEQYMVRIIKEREESVAAIQTLKEELEMMKKTDQEHVQQLESQKRDVELELQKTIKETEDLLNFSRRKSEELEAISAMELQSLRLRDTFYQKFLSGHVQALQEMRVVSQQTKEEVIEVQKSWKTEIAMLEEQLKGIANAATKYHTVLAENRQLYNEVQDLKGNIRVYCRVRPFLSGESGKHTTIEYIGENGELLVANPNKQGKDSQRMFNFNKVFGPSASQEEVFLDTRPLIRSVLDGYNVCIFAYGQTGSGKTFTMSGLNSSSEEGWGVNYRALNDLFQISQKRREFFQYKVGVQMIEIYNEQVRDLLINDGSQKRLGIRSISQHSGLSVPDASMFHVESTADVLDLMKIGQRNRVVGATALNERSSRSHSVLTVHVQGTDLSSGAVLRGCLHLVDLAGSERVDKSEVTGDRLREAQHINKSLSALGDVIYALANKNAHVPYRNSKLTQILQDSLGGQAKTLMFVQLNPDIESYSETISTLKFAERVSGVELGAARSNKESKDFRDLKEQVAMMKDVIAKKDAEIDRLQTLKEPRVHAQDVYVPNEKLRVKSHNVATGGQDHHNQSLTTGRPGSSEGHQRLACQASKHSLQQSTHSSQDCESTSTGDSDDMCGKYSTPAVMRCGMTSKRSVDSEMGLSSSQVSTKLQKNSAHIPRNVESIKYPRRRQLLWPLLTPHDKCIIGILPQHCIYYALPLPSLFIHSPMAAIAVVQSSSAQAVIAPRFESPGPSVSLTISNSGRLRIGKNFLGQQLTLKCRQIPQGRRTVLLAPVSAQNGRGQDGEDNYTINEEAAESSQRFVLKQYQDELAARIKSKEFTSESSRLNLQKIRNFLVKFGSVGRAFAKTIAVAEWKWRIERAYKMPEATGNIRAVIGEPFFVPLYNLFLSYGGVFRLKFGPKSFVIVSDPMVAKHILKDNSKSYSKGILAEILDFVMGKGLIPADGELWRVRRRAIVPALHRKYVEAMLDIFGRATDNLCKKLDAAANDAEDVEMESLFSRLTLDIIGKAVFNYEFDSLSNDTGIIEAVYDVLREAEARSTALIPYWNIPIVKDLSPRQRKVSASLKLINEILDDLINICKRMVEEENVQFHEEYVNERDPSILHFLLASGDDVSSKQLRDDLMTMLIAGHETSAAVLTWAFYLLAQNPEVTLKIQREVDSVLGDRLPIVEDMRNLKYTTRVINEALRLYPQPPVLIRRSLGNDVLGRYPIKKNEDIFISVWNLHRSPHYWVNADKFMPERWPVNGPNPNENTENFSYLPFGGGPRKCVGDMFATFETVTATAMLIRRFNFELSVGAPPVGMTTGATIHTTEGLKMTVTHRTRPPVIPVIPVMEVPTVTMVGESGLIKSYKASNGSATVLNPETQEAKLNQNGINRNEVPSSYP